MSKSTVVLTPSSLHVRCARETSYIHQRQRLRLADVVLGLVAAYLSACKSGRCVAVLLHVGHSHVNSPPYRWITTVECITITIWRLLRSFGPAFAVFWVTERIRHHLLMNHDPSVTIVERIILHGHSGQKWRFLLLNRPNTTLAWKWNIVKNYCCSSLKQWTSCPLI